jgi:hypothetical protein
MHTYKSTYIQIRIHIRAQTLQIQTRAQHVLRGNIPNKQRVTLQLQPVRYIMNLYTQLQPINTLTCNQTL